MCRTAIEKLYLRKESKNRRSPIIEGARQAGKTRLMKKFVCPAYANTVYINFDSNSAMAEPFAPNVSVRTSTANYRKEDGLVNLPLYAAEEPAEAGP